MARHYREEPAPTVWSDPTTPWHYRDHMRVLVISDPLESGRQIHSDGGTFLRDVVSERSDLGHVTLVTPAEDEVADELRSLRVAETAAVIFETNSLRHPDSIVATAARSCTAQLSQYLKDGGGVLILHQFVRDRPVLELSTDTVTFTAHEGQVLPLSLGTPRSVLEVPHRVDENSEPPAGTSSQLGELVSWLALDAERLAGSDIVLRSAQGLPLVSVSSSEVTGRLAVSAMPLDWHHWQELLANLVRYVVHGDPRTIIWGDGSRYEPTVERALASGTAVRARRTPPIQLERLHPAPVLHIDSDGPEKMPASARRTALRRGATVLTPAQRQKQRLDTGMVEYSVEVGSASYRYAQAALSTLASSEELLTAAHDPYLLRNVIVSSEHFGRKYWSPQVRQVPSQDTALIASTSGSIRFEKMTTTSALVSLQTHYLLRPHDPAIDQLVRTIQRYEGSANGGLYAGATQVLTGELRALTWLRRIGEHRFTSIATLSRIADWIAYLDARNRLAPVANSEEGPAIAAQVLQQFTEILEERSGLEHLSHEAEANLVLGLCSLRSLGCLDAEDLIHQLVPDLERWLSDHRDALHISARMRVLHALARAEEVSPSGAHGIQALELVSSPIEREIAAESGAGETLAARNKRLLEQITTLEKSAHSRLTAYRVGVVCACLVAVAVPAMLAVLVLTELGASSYSDLLIPALIGCVLLLLALLTVFRRIGLIPWSNDSAFGRAIEDLRKRFWPTTGP